jgi:hypothetical protein
MQPGADLCLARPGLIFPDFSQIGDQNWTEETLPLCSSWKGTDRSRPQAGEMRANFLSSLVRPLPISDRVNECPLAQQQHS